MPRDERFTMYYAIESEFANAGVEKYVEIIFYDHFIVVWIINDY